MTGDLVLASTSPYRRELLARLGLPFRCTAPGIDEDALRAGLSSAESAPPVLAQLLARAKAAAVAAREAAAVVIGSDQVCALGAQVFGKPGNADAAAAQLLALQGQRHQLFTAVAVQRGSEVVAFTDVTTLRMRALTADEVRRYVEADRPLDCAGSYKLERAGIALFEAIDSQDHTAIVGLPLLALASTLRRFGCLLP